MFKTLQKFNSLLLIITLFWCTLIVSAQNRDSLLLAKEHLDIANKIIDIKPDSSLVLYQKALPFFKANKKHHNTILCHIGISDVYKNKGQYSLAYDHLWDALIIAEETSDTATTILVNRDLGRLYSIYEKYDSALSHFNTALSYAKQFNDLNKITNFRKHNLYYSLAVTNRKAENYSRALSYLDSCSINNPQNSYSNSTPYIDVEKGYIYLKTEQVKSSEKHLLKAHQYFIDNKLSYQIISALYIGDLFYQQEDWKKAENYYLECLEALEHFTSHGDIKVELLRKLADTETQLNKTSSGYRHLDQAMQITDSLFNAKTAINNELFQIKNKYKETINEKNAFIKEQNLIIDHKNIIQSRLVLFVAFISLALIALIFVLRMRQQLHNASLEKKQIEMQAKHDKEKAEEIMAIKSRELTANTLKIIEKEQTIKELLQTIKDDSPSNYKSLKHKTSKSSKDMWEQFNIRFTEVNSNFYEALRIKHPNLTPTEQKHCALIKLKFDSKEMASLLNISLNSVHISRHRIRKKMGLEREDSLSNFIADIKMQEDANI